MLSVKELISRADEITVQEIIGNQTIKILNLMNNGNSYTSKLKKIILDLHSEEKLLTDKKFRDILIDLMRPEEIKTVARILGIYSPRDEIYAVYERVKNLNFRKNSEHYNLLLSVFDVTQNYVSTEQEKEPIVTEVTGNYQLFEHQRIAAARVMAILNSGHERVLLHMPTGSGKTRTTMNIIADYLRMNEKKIVIWLANTEELCEQAASEFEKAWSFLGNREVSVSRLWGSSEIQLNSLHDGLLVAGLPKLISKYRDRNGRSFVGSLAKKVSLIIFDEAHQSVAPVYNEIVSILLDIGESKKLIGLSATPGRSFEDQEADLKLAHFFHKKKVKLEVAGYDNPVDYLTDAGYLAQVTFKPLIYENEKPLLTEKDKAELKGVLEYPKQILSKLAEDEKRNLLIINEAIRLASNHKRIILFAPSVNCSNIISFILESQGIHSRSLTGETDNQTRKKIIEDFKNEDNYPKVLCNYGVLTTGFDAPRTSAAIIGRPTMSLVLYSQMVGRAIRGVNAGGNEFAEIITVIDQDLPGFRSVAEAFENWEVVWND
ncbi:DEAD/DEAH box helicase [Lysinibacillus antri]|uniref:DEAD/DEAH box helicase n=1 Tax=Lysinibacillus antri TaxID=2498145 RepID=A0A432L798_9BACI|nr:DEAD/DEAH box helicase [Lysinibacillus antri]RUL46533.1 DEAD/DEAH box helicase [Lysinibacillus antri]